MILQLLDDILPCLVEIFEADVVVVHVMSHPHVLHGLITVHQDAHCIFFGLVFLWIIT